MQFFNSSQFPASCSRLPQGPAPRPRATGLAAKGAARKLDCGWYNSSLDLAQGLEVIEEDDDSLYQLWELSAG